MPLHAPSPVTPKPKPAKALRHGRQIVEELSGAAQQVLATQGLWALPFGVHKQLQNG